ncbi:hypothetical protein [Microbacterium sp. Root180]|nr:hypothetical protein [Microbacterium sp. Root180]
MELDLTLGGAPEGRDWELDGLDEVVGAADTYYRAALDARQNRRR